ncbi:TonB-dependent receptor [uncultured Sphingomonas sp.]|uniref:TonB-dependent receptor n=1 Tax=uncultured Sphingomonas sp. TaxID=158754 RepID=UPI0035C9E126
MKGNSLQLLFASTALSLFAGGLASPAFARSAMRASYNIAAQPLGTALKQFARENGIQVLFAEADVAGKATRGLSGRFTNQEALAQLLGDGRLSVQMIRPKVFVIRNTQRLTAARATHASLAAPLVSAVAQEPQAGTVPGGRRADAAEVAEEDAPVADIIVTGQRASLTAAADIKRDSALVVDSIVADDISKFPDPTTASALQRVPGVQVFIGDNNEPQSPIIRGIGDILTTLDGREIFSGVGRGFSFQDLPAEALAGADVFKSNSANLIEGGVAGVIDLKLRKPLSLKDGLTIGASAQAFYAKNPDKFGPLLSGLLAYHGERDGQEFGALLNVSYSDLPFDRPISFNCDPRSGNNGPPGAGGVILPTCVGGLNQVGRYQRPQVNGALQWKPTPELELYADGLFTGYRSRNETSFIFSDIFAAESVTNVVPSDECGEFGIDGGGFYNGSITGSSPLVTGGAGRQQLCYAESARFNNVPGLTSTQARTTRTNQYLGAVGARYDADRVHLDFDLSYQESKTRNRTIIVDIGKQIAATDVVINDGGNGTTDMPGNPLGDPNDFRFANGLFQDINEGFGSLWAARLDAAYDVGGFVRQLQAGVRYADRATNFQGFQGGPAAPGGNRVTLVNSVGLPADFLRTSRSSIRYINGGQNWVAPDRDFLLDQTDVIRALYGAPAGDPAFQPTRNYDATEKTYAAYAQAAYEVELGGGARLDGLLGGRLTKTDRTLVGTGLIRPAPTPTDPNPSAVATPVETDTSDTDFLPNFSARLRLDQNLQFRFSATRTLARPAFGDLNPGLTYEVPNNANVQPNGGGGNPDLKPQKADALDATVEYYWGRSNYLSAAVYWRKLKNRTVSGTNPEVIDGVTYNITRPRNAGAATLQGLEVSGQTFLDFLPGALSGLGAVANFTLADSEITTEGDILEGEPLLGVSKYSYNLGLLYERSKFTGRLIYTYRSKYNEFSIGNLVRPIGQVVGFNKVRGFGRLDFTVSYDVSENVTFSVNGTNINRSKYRSYFDQPFFPHDIRDDDSTYFVGIRTRF